MKRMNTVEFPDNEYWQKQVKCQYACPVHTDSRGYVRAISEGDFEKAYLIHLFQEMIEAGVDLRMVTTAGDYMEIDTEQDYALANRDWPGGGASV